MFLNSKEKKNLLKDIESSWGAVLDSDYVYIRSKDNIYITTSDISKIPFENLRVNSIGVYFAEYTLNKLRLSIEGSQIVGPKAKKNVIELTKEEITLWLNGHDIETKESERAGFVLISYQNNFFASGKIKNNKILNYLPKTRRIKTMDIPE